MKFLRDAIVKGINLRKRAITPSVLYFGHK